MKRQLTDSQRMLILKAVDGFAPNLPLIFTLKQHYPACDSILNYLIKNKIIGVKLFNWVKVEFCNSPLKAWQYCLSKIESDKNKKIILGKDFY